MRVRVLGTAAGGGYPQWNCACVRCGRARTAGVSRTQDCLAISADGRAWYLVNASPDLRAQLLATPELGPGPGARETPLRGVLFTDAELDHTIGLLTLREAERLAVYGPAPVLDALEQCFPARALPVDWRPLAAGEPSVLDGGLRVTAVPLGAKRPRYLPPALDAAVACYRFEAAGGECLVYAPCLAAWTGDFDAALSGASCVLLDGSFFTDDEMARAAGGGGTARSMGHLPIRESLPRLAAHPDVRALYTHLNNTNPVLDPGCAEAAELAAAGAEIAEDGQLIEP